MAWKSGSAAALRNRNEKERQEKTVMATAAGGAEPLSQRKSADSRNPLALGRTENLSAMPKPPTLGEVARRKA